MKVAKLVTVSLTTRVVVEDNADDETIMETAKPQLVDKIMNESLENVEVIIDDTTFPYGSFEEEK